jgi:hypothetical protein
MIVEANGENLPAGLCPCHCRHSQDEEPRDQKSHLQEMYASGYEASIKKVSAMTLAGWFSYDSGSRLFWKS